MILFLISFAGRSRSQETQDSINKTCPGIFDNLYFVKDKNFKKDVCNFLGCDLMIDDRVDVLDTLVNTKTLGVLFGDAFTWSNWEYLTVLSPISAIPNPMIDLSKKVYKLN